jgi:hypothetical protein
MRKHKVRVRQKTDFIKTKLDHHPEFVTLVQIYLLVSRKHINISLIEK